MGGQRGNRERKRAKGHLANISPKPQCDMTWRRKKWKPEDKLRSEPQRGHAFPMNSHSVTIFPFLLFPPSCFAAFFLWKINLRFSFFFLSSFKIYAVRHVEAHPPPHPTHIPPVPLPLPSSVTFFPFFDLPGLVAGRSQQHLSSW